MDRPSKRLAPSDGDGKPSGKGTPVSLTHPISPPLKKRRLAAPLEEKKPDGPPSVPSRVFKSPFQLTKIRDLPAEMNKDTITLRDILGDPLIAECWEFNYLHDIDFLMAAFDQDVRHLVKVHVVHGFWKREDPSRLELQEVASRHPNVTLHNAFLPEMFGTHHSKMMILLRHDETAQIVIHTANMIIRDWTNMTQAVWLSPRLPLMKPSQLDSNSPEEAQIGSGAKFKLDFLKYLRAYDTRRTTCKPIIDHLIKYDFSAIRGSLIASVPGRHKLNNASPTKWGWAAMQQALSAVPVSPASNPEIAIQISSIATLGPTDTWLKNTFFRALSGGIPKPPPQQPPPQPQPPSFKVIFPTPDEIRKSLDGYSSGGSIHTKTQSPQQIKQLAYLKPLFCHWANDAADGTKLTDGTVAIKEAGRKRAAPHIKTYIRYGGTNKSSNHESIDWALVTSANLSKQAWGEAVSSSSTGEMRIASYEIGVLVWPGLYGEGATMRGTFLTDSLAEGEVVEEEGKAAAAVALRMPYNLPLQAYGKGEVPWVATASHLEPDWMGQVWRHG
ncbi:tyrosyl-DNA phosphodiesterase I [Parachaetomium inaequale]|uniref:Tyrosyl-DNA phosphodiesterase I n=1 Tax=Parachaetomium inaequale TaxID=2588326 RepID=A0AAN6PJI9_9PEZI|nr:tyrosyl-DNA phosphodiesterase I [Parachaetomium inaequale]